MKLAICVATMRPNHNINVGPGDIPLFTSQSVTMPQIYVQYNTTEENLGVVRSYQKLYESVGDAADILCYLHDDVICREKGWDERVLREFEDEKVAVVGFGGALQHGTNDIYKTPYRLQQLQRAQYLSNVDDAEVHGARFTGSCDAAVLDGYCIAVRRGFLDSIGGWNSMVNGCDFFCYDYAICALARRHGYRIRVVGVRCHHRGGQTSVLQKDAVKDVIGQEEYDRSHKWFYDEFRDVMPARVG